MRCKNCNCDEIWGMFPTDHRYEISSLGRIRNFNTKKILKPSSSGSGYLLFTRYLDDVFTGMYVHHAVASAFIGERPDGLQVSHLDGDKFNNKLCNLTYETSKENINRKIKHGTHPTGFKNSQAKLTEDDVIKLREYYEKNDISFSKLGEIFGVSGSSAHRAVRKISWSDT